MIRTLIAAVLIAIMTACCEPECTDAEIDYCERETVALESYCECLEVAGCERSCEWQQAGCDDE